MQVGVDVTCMYTNFGGCDLSSFRDTANIIVISLYSMMAVRAGAARVYACELSDVMTGLCQDIVDNNEMSDQIEVIHSISTQLTHLPDR